MQPRSGDEVAGELDVSQRAVEAGRDQMEEEIVAVDAKVRVLRSERDAHPEARVVGEKTPFLTDGRDVSELTVLQVGEDMKQEFVGQLLDRLLQA